MAGGDIMIEITRYLNGVEISKEELYSRQTVTDEMKNVLKDVRDRIRDAGSDQIDAKG